MLHLPLILMMQCTIDDMYWEFRCFSTSVELRTACSINMWDYDQVMMLHNVIFANYLGDLCPHESLTVKKLHAQFNGTPPTRLLG